MASKIKWRRYSPDVIDVSHKGLLAVVSVTQYGTYPSTKRYTWRVERGNTVLGIGTELSQRKAKELAERYFRA